MSDNTLEYEMEHTDAVVIGGEEPEPIRLELDGPTHDFISDSLQIRRTKTGFRLGWLVYDGDAQDPFDGDGMGQLGNCDRHDGGPGQHEVYQKALGLDSNWSKRVTASSLIDELAASLDKLWSGIVRDPHAPDAVTFDEMRAQLKQPYRGKWDALVEQYRKDGDLGDPDVVILDVYKHSGIHLSVGYNHHYPDRQWDCAYGGYVWVPDDSLREEVKGLDPKARRARMLEFAQQAVETFNDWANGSVYGVVIQDHGPDGALKEQPDSCFGYIGLQYAEKELADRMAWEQREEPV